MIVVGVRFKAAGKVYYFDPTGIELNINDGVIVETARGMEYGTIVIAPRDVPDSEVVQPLKPIIRKATAKDQHQVEKNREREKKALSICLEKIVKHKLPMKLIDVDYTFDMGKIIFFFTADGRIDFRELVRDLASVFRTRIELRQIGLRDEAKMVGGIGCCGRPLCCASFLGDFKPVSIRMAKGQGMSLNPTKISGICGRLMCCLRYENDLYTSGELKCTNCQHRSAKSEEQSAPAVGQRVITDDGLGTILRVHMKDHTVKVQLESGHTVNISWADIAVPDQDD
ncbi:stage 0 sporulation family protein [Megasphaera paucivorans]|uniref:Cell fate regulator YaaT, PSP1 superfamily (Controls sporulation, competence, biofilm development) n=1 Tax=Megasphaera paucivorans TaxID=349095 RepID=A0A1G9XC57_9FIRM|nr:stage 0 sporulation family protein [Megasphaera paucivorans]SDM94026.1 Cell fate regulator YaaT, PSP1 superfamily (controls sporulation, competence, biofilm development) [Megasphaera paucivorans]